MCYNVAVVERDSLAAVNRQIVTCVRCPRLVEYRERVAREKRRLMRLPGTHAAPIGQVPQVNATVYRGDGEALQICCGTFNMAVGDLVPLATSVFRDFAFPFEVASVLLLAAMVGAIVLVKRDDE